MVQLKIFSSKPVELVAIGEGDGLGDQRSQRQSDIQRRRNVARCILMVMIIAAVSLSSFCLLKQMCSLKAENARLRGEHQRYLYLKEMIRAQVPEDRFIHNMPRSVSIIETDEDVETSWWSVNLSILWTPDSITRCDIYKLAHRLAIEIYGNMDTKAKLN